MKPGMSHGSGDPMEDFGPTDVGMSVGRGRGESGRRPKLPLEDKERKMLPILTFLAEYFPDVIVELTQLCVKGNIQHNPELNPADIKWAREKSTDQLNTAFRHLFDRATGTHYDKDGAAHLIKTIWRAAAQRQLDIEAERDSRRPSPVVPGVDPRPVEDIADEVWGKDRDTGITADEHAPPTMHIDLGPVEPSEDPRCPYVFAGRWRCTKLAKHDGGHFSPCDSPPADQVHP